MHRHILVNNVMPKILKEKLSDVIILENHDGLILYQTNNMAEIIKLPFFNNTFLVLTKININSNSNFSTSLKQIVTNFKLNKEYINENLNLKKYKTFKILGIDKNQPTSIDFSIVKPIENKIKENLKLNIGVKKHDLDFVFLRRDEDFILFLLKLTYNRLTEKNIQKGSLRPELAYILSYLADIKTKDVIIDPFCGSASISRQIVKHFKYNMIFLSDNSEETITKLKLEYKKNNKNIFIKNRNALDLNYIKDCFIDKIITDPPWNIYNKQEENFTDLYIKMLKEFNRILSPNGKIIILMGNRNEFETALDNTRLFSITNMFNILVNGKKANVYELENKKQN